jgi:anthranilate phosphoribosyltransferase
MASSDYRSILYSGLLNPNVAFVHMMVSHPDYQQPAAELLSALSIVKGLVFPSNFLGGQYSHEFGAVKEINNSLILDCSYSINRFRSLFDDDFPFSNSGFHCEKTLIDAFFDGEINHRFGVDVILHAASALYVCDLFSSFNDASEAVVKSINAKKPKAVLKQLLSFNHSYIHRSAHQ